MNRFRWAAVLALACAASGVLGAQDPAQEPEEEKSVSPEQPPQLVPTCPGCVGENRALGPGAEIPDWSLAIRYVATPESRSWWRVTLDRRITNRFTLGVEYTPTTGEVYPRFSWFVTPETDALPGVTLALVGDRLSTPEETAAVLTLFKSIPETPVMVFVGGKLETKSRRLYFPFGATVQLSDRMSFQAINDTNHTHMLLTYFEGSTSYSLVLARMQHIGFQVGVRF